jgi:hypothetical protein
MSGRGRRRIDGIDPKGRRRGGDSICSTRKPEEDG